MCGSTGFGTGTLLDVLTNLERISAKGDPSAERLLARTPPIVDAEYLRSIDALAAQDLGRYGTRQTTIALRRRSLDHLVDALTATALAAATDAERGDPRDLMVALSLHHVVAREIESDPAALFAQVADRLPGTPIADLLREFGRRGDVTLTAFGWKQVQTEDGPDFIPE